ncbi:MAG: exodeoxyribonuclease III [Candidatus Absconditabacterales bacterium]|nr:exodeoxyribonuclease III [Candidatus Absconditabacterales bacterium]
MKILSRNVNGIRSIVKKGFAQTILALDPDVICLQEPKAFLDQAPLELLDLGYHITWHAGTRPGYAGTVIMTKKQPSQTKNTFDHTMFHEDGRLTQIDLDGLVIINGYFPNGGSRADGTEMLSYKLAFYDHLMDYTKQLHHTPHLIIGDLNICHQEIDIARPKENQTSIGFLPVERSKLTQFFESGYVDTFRAHYPERRDAYTWRSPRAGARERNIGRRIDYACASTLLMPHVRAIDHFDHITGSDHCPIMLEIEG